MFRNCTESIRDAVCSVGVGSPSSQGRLFGIGCMLSQDLAITALHVITRPADQGTWPVVMNGEGLFRCTVAFASERQDLALLRLEEKVRDFEPTVPTRFPLLAPIQPSLGSSVGYLARLHKPDLDGVDQTYTYFSQAYVSFFLHDRHPSLLLALNGGYIESGFSGGPVFTSDGSLVGILVQALQFFGKTGANPQMYTFPVMSPVATIENDLALIMGQV